MVALELFLSSSIYTAGGLVAYYYKSLELRKVLHLAEKGEEVEKLVEMAVERVEQDAPIYLNSGGQHPGLLVPIGGGTRTEMRPILTAIVAKERGESKFNWRITDFEGQPCAVPKRFWLNSADDLKTYFESNDIPQNLSPLSLPMQVREITLPTAGAAPTLYATSEYAVAGTNLNRVVAAAVWPRTIGAPLWRAAAAVAAGSGMVLWLNWRDNQQRVRPMGLKEFAQEHVGW